MGEKNDGPEGRDREDGGYDWLRGFRLVPVEDVVGELDVMCVRARTGEDNREGVYQTGGSDAKEGTHLELWE